MPELNLSAIPTATNNPDYPTSSNNTSHDNPQSYSDQKHLRSSRKASGQTTKRDTHFISFPLVTDHSIPQLAASLAQFRRVTTITPEVGNEDDDEPEEELKILPAVVHRPPGTFHLTIGTMNLSEKSEMERAVRVLKGLDLRGMLGHVEREVGSRATKEDDERRKEKKSSIEKGDELRSPTRPISPPPPPAAATTSSEPAFSSLTSSPSSRPPSPITISLSGLSTFPGPQHARVFYAPPIDLSHRLLSLANKIRAVFKAEGCEYEI
ncbi:hypothetical protein DV736_g1765, partial [Chaetothyriales sp. CBS 134916]